MEHYQQQQIVGERYEIGVDNYIPTLMQKWKDGFRTYRPLVRFDTNLRGTEAAMTGLYGDVADLAFIGLQAYRPEIDAFKQRFGYEPLNIEISSGSFNTPHKTFALMVYVPKDNPLKGLTMVQLEAIVGCGCTGRKKIRTWGDVGLHGEWAQRSKGAWFCVCNGKPIYQTKERSMKSAIFAITFSLAAGSAVHGQENQPLRLVAKIPVPTMTGTWDHLAADPVTKRLFLSAQDDNAVQVIDLGMKEPLNAITGGFNRPQGIYYIPGVNVLAVSNGRDGTLRSFEGKSFAPIKTIPLTLGADMMDYDPQTKYLYVDHGGVDSNRGPGGLAIIDVAKWEQVGNIGTEYRPAALEIDRASHRLFVTLPGLSEVGVIDMKTQQIVFRFQAAKPTKPVALALDSARGRLFVGTRTPDSFTVFDTETGRVIATLDSVGGIEGMYFDARQKRIYVTGLEGVVEAYQEIDANHYRSIEKIPIVPKAGTSLFIPALNLFCVAAPPYGGTVAQIWLFEPQP